MNEIKWKNSFVKKKLMEMFQSSMLFKVSFDLKFKKFDLDLKINFFKILILDHSFDLDLELSSFI